MAAVLPEMIRVTVKYNGVNEIVAPAVGERFNVRRGRPARKNVQDDVGTPAYTSSR
jgi:hypothetical protein